MVLIYKKCKKWYKFWTDDMKTEGDDDEITGGKCPKIEPFVNFGTREALITAVLYIICSKLFN